MDVNEKLDNFKRFVKEVSRDTETIKQYEDMSWFKMQGLAYVLLIPQRHNLDMVVVEMQKKLDFDDEHKDKFKRYLSFFIEYMTGEAPDYQSEELSYEEHLEKIIAMQGAGK